MVENHIREAVAGSSDNTVNIDLLSPLGVFKIGGRCCLAFCLFVVTLCRKTEGVVPSLGQTGVEYWSDAQLQTANIGTGSLVQVRILSSAM